ncbi:MAG: tetratricopeptide repeat protein, partial [Spirochaetales bacterium]|nr:tetratricopeptide repeat protein [Spirochaetales bacterium]
YYPAFLNLGNLYFQDKNYTKALEYYREAEQLKPDYWLIQLQLSRVFNELGNFDRSADYFTKVRKSNPEMAEHYAFLDLNADASARASSQAAGDVMLWADEE